MAKSKATEETTEVVTQTSSFAVAEIDETQYESNFTFNADEKATAFLKQAQALSHEIDKSDSAYIKGLEVGGLFITGINKVFNDGCYIVPTYMEKEHILWKPDNGGYDGKQAWTQELQDQLIRDGSKDFLQDGRQVVTSLTYYVLVVDPENPNQLPTPAILSCASTKSTIAKKLNAMLNTAQFENKLPNGSLPAIYRFLVSIAPVSQINAKKEKFYNYSFKIEKSHAYVNQKGMIAVPAILDAAKTFADLAASSKVIVDYAADKDGAGGDAQTSNQNLV